MCRMGAYWGRNELISIKYASSEFYRPSEIRMGERKPTKFTSQIGNEKRDTFHFCMHSHIHTYTKKKFETLQAIRDQKSMDDDGRGTKTSSKLMSGTNMHITLKNKSRTEKIDINTF